MRRPRNRPDLGRVRWVLWLSFVARPHLYAEEHDGPQSTCNASNTGCRRQGSPLTPAWGIANEVLPRRAIWGGVKNGITQSPTASYATGVGVVWLGLDRGRGDPKAFVCGKYQAFHRKQASGHLVKITIRACGVDLDAAMAQTYAGEDQGQEIMPVLSSITFS
jgi:hypothetical protein